MTPLRSRVTDTASPWMLIVSIGLHVLALVVVVLVSPSLVAPQKIPEKVISHVKLVEPPSSAPPAAVLPTQPVAEMRSMPAPEVVVAPRPEDPASPSREVVQAASPQTARTKTVPLKKRKRAVQRVEEPPAEKPKEAKKPKGSEDPEKPQLKEKEKEVAAKQTTEKEKPKEPENPIEYLEKQMQAKREAVEKRKGQAAPTASRQGSDSSAPSTDEELVRWLGLLKDRINEQWSVYPDNSTVKRVTVIGVQIAENGALADPKVKVSSEDLAFDRSALRAVLQAAPFPPALPEVRDKIRQAGGLALRFTPGGLQ